MRVYVGIEKRRSRETQGANLAMKWRMKSTALKKQAEASNRKLEN